MVEHKTGSFVIGF